MSPPRPVHLHAPHAPVHHHHHHHPTASPFMHSLQPHDFPPPPHTNEHAKGYRRRRAFSYPGPDHSVFHRGRHGPFMNTPYELSDHRRGIRGGFGGDMSTRGREIMAVRGRGRSRGGLHKGPINGLGPLRRRDLPRGPVPQFPPPHDHAHGKSGSPWQQPYVPWGPGQRDYYHYAGDIHHAHPHAHAWHHHHDIAEHPNAPNKRGHSLQSQNLASAHLGSHRGNRQANRHNFSVHHRGRPKHRDHIQDEEQSSSSSESDEDDDILLSVSPTICADSDTAVGEGEEVVEQGSTPMDTEDTNEQDDEEELQRIAERVTRLLQSCPKHPHQHHHHRHTQFPRQIIPDRRCGEGNVQSCLP